MYNFSLRNGGRVSMCVCVCVCTSACTCMHMSVCITYIHILKRITLESFDSGALLSRALNLLLNAHTNIRGTGKATIIVTQLTNYSPQLIINVVDNRKIDGRYFGGTGLFDVLWNK